MTVIDKPGFYTSMAGKCEVKDCNGRFALGWCNELPVIWNCLYGTAQGTYYGGEYNITGPWTDKPKPIECWCVTFEGGHRQYFNTKTKAEYYMRAWNIDGEPRHLREFWEDKP